MSGVRRRIHDPGDDSGQARHVGGRAEDTDRELRKLRHRLAELEAEVAVVAQGMGPQQLPARTDVGAVNRDARWHCKKCGYLLGFYDLDQDVLRTRYKEHIVFVRAGVGGFVQIICRGCSEVNTEHYVDPEAADG